MQGDAKAFYSLQEMHNVSMHVPLGLNELYGVIYLGLTRQSAKHKGELKWSCFKPK